MKEVKNINDAAVDQQTIDTLKELLVEAEKGNLRSIIFVDKYNNGQVGSGWSGQPNKTMIGELEMIKQNYLLQVIQSQQFEYSD